jgi:hypothetical protein
MPSGPAVFAYLDPGTGSMAVSAIVGIFASVALAVKTYWHKIKGFFRRDNKQIAGNESPLQVKDFEFFISGFYQGIGTINILFPLFHQISEQDVVAIPGLWFRRPLGLYSLFFHILSE